MIVPPKLAALLHQLADLARHPPGIAGQGPTQPWLFPGIIPGRPAGPSGFSSKLLDHAIDSSPARNTALIAMVTDIPAPVLADLLGLSIKTATRWADLAKRDWTDYLAARANDLKHQNTAPPE